MKITLKITAIYHYINKKSKTQFVKLELVKSRVLKEEWYTINKKNVAYHNSQKNDFIIGNKFIFDSNIHAMIEKTNIDEDGFVKTTNIIINKSITNESVFLKS